MVHKVLNAHVPRLSSRHWSRSNLVGALVDGPPLVVVRAPAGSGKTSLLVEFAQALSSGEDCALAWVIGPMGTNSQMVAPDEFWSRVCAALRIGNDETGQHEDPEQAFLDYLATHEGKIQLIIDDCSFVPRESVETLLRLLQAHGSFSLAVASRGPTRFESSRASLLADMIRVDVENLRFTPDEQTEFLKAHVGGLADTTAAAVHQLTRGDATLTRLALEYLLVHEDVEDRQSIDSLARHLEESDAVDLDLALADDKLSKPILLLALSDGVTEEIAAELLGDRSVRATLDALEKLGLGTWSAEPDRSARFEYAEAVKLALRERAFELLTQTQISAACSKIIELETRAGDPISALAAAVACRAWSAAEDIAVRYAAEIHSAPCERLMAIMRSTPSTLGASFPILGSLQASVFSQIDGAGFGSHEIHFRPESSRRGHSRITPERDALVYTAAGVAARKRLRGPAALEPVARSTELFDSVPHLAAVLPAGTLALAKTANASTLLSVGEWEEARRALPIGYDADTKTVRDYLSATTAAVLALTGDMREAENLAASIATPQAANTLLSEATEFMLGVFSVQQLLESFKVQEAQAALSTLRANALCTEYWGLIAFLQAEVDLLAGEACRGLTRLTSAMDDHATEDLAPGLKAELDALKHLLETALDARGLRAAVDSQGNRSNIPPARLLSQARMAFHAGRYAQALRNLSRVRTSAAATRRHRAEAQALTAAALLRHDCDLDLEKETKLLVATLSHHGMRLPLALLPADDTAGLVARENGRSRGPNGLSELMEQVLISPLSLVKAQPLTRREQQVLQELAHDLTLIEIGERLFLSENTVRTHVKAIYRKLGASKRKDALAIAASHGLLSDADA